MDDSIKVQVEIVCTKVNIYYVPRSLPHTEFWNLVLLYELRCQRVSLSKYRSKISQTVGLLDTHEMYRKN
jgi:hypothetical protein